ncbi:MAG TPA: NADP-specific glutamate dehydrogenase [Bacilli bacterium]|nr:NADP-specific glutamate dehydrogenase [Bacilli bacterium]
MLKTKYLLDLYHDLVVQNKGEKEFHQAVLEMFQTLDPVIHSYPEIITNNIIPELLKPERIIEVEIDWVNEKGENEQHLAYRIQYSSTLGVYKGGLRYSPNVSISIFKFLAFEQTFKNALTTLPMGGGKGGANFNPRGRSAKDIKLFTEAFITALAPYLGADTDVPAGDIGVGQREVMLMVEKYSELKDDAYGAFTGKLPDKGGILGRKEATGHGLVYFVEEALAVIKKTTLNNKKVVVSGSGNVALYAAFKAREKGATVVAMSDSDGYVYNPEGLDLDIIKEIKETKRERIRSYLDYDKAAIYENDAVAIWGVKCDIALPCATQNELDETGVAALIKNGVIFVAEGANMPTTKTGVELLRDNKILFAPGKAANAGGVYVSGLEMIQHQKQVKYTFTEVDAKLQSTMKAIFQNSYQTAKTHNRPNDLLFGANLSSFLLVAEKMLEIRKKHTG